MRVFSEDLNSYSETCISLMGVHALDLRLFPIFRTLRLVDPSARTDLSIIC